MPEYENQLCAWAIPTPSTDSTPQWADHTFATYELRTETWSCSSGSGTNDPTHPNARFLRSARGSHSKARCLGKANSLILWGVTGVCHQCTNRILKAAGGITVAGARGWRTSHTLYGTYGINLNGSWSLNKIRCRIDRIPLPIPIPWPFLVGTSDLPDLPDEVTEFEGKDEFSSLASRFSPDNIDEQVDESLHSFHTRLSRLEDRAFATPEERQAEDLAILLEESLGNPLPSSQLYELQNLQLDFQRKWLSCHAACAANEFETGELCKYRRNLTESLFTRFEQSLGEANCIALYDVSPSAIAAGLPRVTEPPTDCNC